MKKRTLIACIAFMVAATLQYSIADSWRFPGEFEEQQAVWVGWLSKEYMAGYHTDDVFLPMVKALVPNIDVVIAVPSEDAREHVSTLLKENNVDTSRVSYFVIPYAVPYWRDFGPIFIKNDNHEFKIADFNFNCWGYYSLENLQSRIFEKIDRKVADHLNLDSVMTRVVSEGGDRILNGKGTLLVVENCEFQRNPNMSRSELEEEYKRLLGVTKVIWLKQGTYDDDACNTSTLPGPDGKGVAYRCAAANNHADEFCRFIDAHTILLAEVSADEAEKSPIEAENRRRMEVNYKILKEATDQDGNPFRIVRIPMPETLYFTAQPTDETYAFLAGGANYTDGSAFPLGEPVQIVPATSYCNFLISNDIVLAQKYWAPGLPESVREKDEAAQNVLKQLFPDRTVIAINSTALNFGGGGIHCSTQQQPK